MNRRTSFTTKRMSDKQFEPELSSTLPSSNTPQISAKEFDTKFNEHIANARQLKLQVNEQLTEYQKKIELEMEKRSVSDAELKRQREICRIRVEDNRNLSSQIALLTSENADIKETLRKSEEHNKCLLERLNSKKMDELIAENSSLVNENADTKKSLRECEQLSKSLLNEVNCGLKRIDELTAENTTLSKEIFDIRKELQKCQEHNKRLHSELSAKKTELKNLGRDFQDIFRQKANMDDRLERIINENSSSTDEKSTSNKRAHEADISVASDSDDNAMPKRAKTICSSSIVDVQVGESVANKKQDANGGPHAAEEVTSTEETTLTEGALIRTTDPMCDNDNATTVSGVANFDIDTYKNPIEEKRRHVRKNISMIMDFDSLTAETKNAYREENERKKRCAHKLQTFSKVYGALPGEVNKLDSLVLDFNVNTKIPLLTVDKRLSTKLKTHQCEGVKFMWDTCFESIEKLKRSRGSGCILSHCMGLGKTLQVIALAHTLITHRVVTKVTKILVLCPFNVILNWVDEFDIWLKDFPSNERVKVYELATCSSSDRCGRVKSWQENGGVFIIGYKMYQMLYQKMDQRKLSSAEYSILYQMFIDPGADLVVCDEGHLLKNPSSQLSVAINKIRTLRRIILTGTPLQNNLKEYFSMVEFIKPRLLGNDKEFNNRFANPIANGQYIDSTIGDILKMKQRANALHKLLEGCVHRRDYSVLAEFLPPKQEHVLFIRLTSEQMDLYKIYMSKHALAKAVPDSFILKKICNHPMVLTDFHDRRKSKQSTAQRNETEFSNSEKLAATDNDWWKPFINGDNIEMSNKMLVLMTILAECDARNEKLIVFSGCLSTLNVIEHFLGKSASSGACKGTWIRDVDYARLDGSQSADKRKRDVSRFNKETNTQLRLFLISTKSGSLGINLISANRVVIFDPSWNPCDDIQCIFRTYRIGQKKECYVYRLISLGTMEEKIYDRQITKVSIAERVIDDHQIGRRYKEEDLQQLYCLKNLDPPVKPEPLSPTEDDLLNAIFAKHPNTVFRHHDHDSLLINIVDETSLDDEIVDLCE